MKTGLTIQQMAQELLRQSKAKQDYLVNTGSLSLSVTTDAPQLRVTENGLDKIAPLDIRQTAHRQLGTYLGIPQKYYELMRTDAPELLAYNANYWFSQKNELRTLRTMDGCARAFLSNRYRRIDNLDIASVTLPVIGELPEARFVSTQITDDFMYIKVVNPRLQADVVPGDVVQAGVIISNSETGLGSVTIQPLIYRLVCSNGMVINDAKTRRNHVGRAATSEEDFSIYSNETLLADDHAFVLKIKDTVRAAISEARFAQVVSRMRESTEAMLDTKQLPAIVKLASSSFGITEDESNGVLEHLITGGDFSLYGLANAVTRFSQDVESYGEPGGTCADCVLNQFGSDGNNKGKACKNMRMLYLLRSGEYMPIQIALPPTSLMPYTRFVNEAFLSRRRKVCTGVVRIGLKKAVSGSHEYCVATFTKIADFAGEDLAHIRAYADGFVAQIKDINAQRAQAGAAASSVIGDGDASHLELPDNGAHFALGAVIDGEREELPA